MHKYNKLYLLEKRLQRIERALGLKCEKVVKGTMPKYFYHGTSSDRALNILKTGLLPNTDNKNHDLSYDGVFITLTLASAKNWAKQLNNSSGYTVLKIDSSYLNPDLLNYDANALAANDMFDDFEDDDFDDLEADNFGDLEADEIVTFPNNLDVEDFVYNGKIPPKAISVVWESFTSGKSAVEAAELIDNNNFKSLFSNWNKYKDLIYKDETIPYLVYLELKNKYGRLGEWNNCAKVIKEIPGDVLSYFDRDGESLLSLITHNARMYNDHSAKLLKELSYRDDISDEAIEHIWSQYTKPKQARDLSDLKDLSDRILLLGKPYIAKKNWKILGI